MPQVPAEWAAFLRCYETYDVLYTPVAELYETAQRALATQTWDIGDLGTADKPDYWTIARLYLHIRQELAEQ